MAKPRSVASVLIVGGSAALLLAACAPARPRGTASQWPSAANPREATTAPAPGEPGSSPGAQSAAGGTTGRLSQEGLSRSEILEIERALQARGFDPGKVDGEIDEETRRALRAFQQANNLRATGDIDAQTARELGVDVAAVSPRERPERS
jgi:peptidoglycan hydrolase-like protein with peptidoglycan-binding domain